MLSSNERKYESRAVREPCGRPQFDSIGQSALPPVTQLKPSDTLLTARARPGLIEHAVRAALSEAMTWRLGGGTAPTQGAFGCAAVAAARRAAARRGLTASERMDVGAIAEGAAFRFFSSPLGLRLMSVPRERIVAAPLSPGDADVAIRDASGHLHLIAVSVLREPLAIAERATQTARRAHLARSDRLAPVRVHIYSLQTGKRREFLRSPANASPVLRDSA